MISSISAGVLAFLALDKVFQPLSFIKHRLQGQQMHEDVKTLTSEAKDQLAGDSIELSYRWVGCDFSWFCSLTPWWPAI